MEDSGGGDCAREDIYSWSRGARVEPLELLQGDLLLAGDCSYLCFTQKECGETRVKPGGAVGDFDPQGGCRVPSVTLAMSQDRMVYRDFVWLERRAIMAGMLPELPVLRITPTCSAWVERGSLAPFMVIGEASCQ